MITKHDKIHILIEITNIETNKTEDITLQGLMNWLNDDDEANDVMNYSFRIKED